MDFILIEISTLATPSHNNHKKNVGYFHKPFTSKPPRNLSHPFNLIFSPRTPKNSANFSLPSSVQMRFGMNNILFRLVGIHRKIKIKEKSYRCSTFHRHTFDQISCTPHRIWNSPNLLALPVVKDPFVCQLRKVLLVFWLCPLMKNGITVVSLLAFGLVCMARLFFGLPRMIAYCYRL